MKLASKERILTMLMGNLIIGAGISIGVFANLGIDPGMTFFYGISHLSGLSLGVTTALCNVLFLLPLLFFDRRRIGLATLINMLFMGFIVDFFSTVIFQGTCMSSGILSYLIMACGIILQSFGVALYSNADLGQSPLDGIPNVLMKQTGRCSYRVYRILQDSTLVIVGFLCGVNIGIGTIMLMFMVGPLIHWFQKMLQSKEFRLNKAVNSSELR